MTRRILNSIYLLVEILGFSFKASTDDLRESPFVEIAERLFGKAYHPRLHDSNVSLAKLVGAKRDYVLNHIPHIADIMVDSADELMEHAQAVIMSNGAPDFTDIVTKCKSSQHVIDLVRISSDTSDSAGYESIAW